MAKKGTKTKKVKKPASEFISKSVIKQFLAAAYVQRVSGECLKSFREVYLLDFAEELVKNAKDVAHELKSKTLMLKHFADLDKYKCWGLKMKESKAMIKDSSDDQDTAYNVIALAPITRFLKSESGMRVNKKASLLFRRLLGNYLGIFCSYCKLALGPPMKRNVKTADGTKEKRVVDKYLNNKYASLAKQMMESSQNAVVPKKVRKADMPTKPRTAAQMAAAKKLSQYKKGGKKSSKTETETSKKSKKGKKVPTGAAALLEQD